MLNIELKQLRRPLFWVLQNGRRNISGGYLKPTSTIHNTTTVATLRQYGILPRQMSFVEEDTLSSKVLQYIRNQREYDTNYTPPEMFEPDERLHCDKFIHQMLLVLVHSTDLKPIDVIKTFSLYITSSHSLLKDETDKKSLMQDVRRKIEQVLPFMTLDELKHFAKILKQLEFKKSSYTKKLMSDVSMECERRAFVSDVKQNLELFNILVILNDTLVYKRSQYSVFMSQFEKDIESARPNDLVHILHYIGLAKKKKLHQEFVFSIVKQLGNHVDNLSFVDTGIAATAIFKTALKLDANSIFVKKVVEHLTEAFKNCCKMNDLELYSFVGMIKLIRATRYEGKHFLPNVSAFIMKANTDILTPEIVAHILALYSNMYVYHPKVFIKMEGLILQYLSTPLDLVRIKDLSRVLWGFSHVRHTCSSEFLRECDKCISEFIQNSGSSSFSEFLAGSLLSLAIMGHYSENIIKEAFEKSKITVLSRGYQRSKLSSRLLMLHKAVKVEHPEFNIALPNIPESDLPTRTYADETRFRPALATLMKGAQVLNEMLDSPIFKLNFTIAHFNFASLVVDVKLLKDIDSTGKSISHSHNHIVNQLWSVSERYGGSWLALELLDSNCTVQDTLEPIGMVELKIRLMKQCGWTVKIVTEEDIARCEGDAQAVAAVILEALDRKSL